METLLTPEGEKVKQHQILRRRNPIYCRSDWHEIYGPDHKKQPLASDHTGPYCSACVRAGRGINPPKEEKPGPPSGTGIRKGTFYLYNLKELKKEKGMSYPEIAKKSGINQSCIADYARLRHAVTPERGKALAKALGVSLKRLRGLTK